MAKTEKISIREFAKRLGITDSAVHRARKDGVFSKGESTRKWGKRKLPCMVWPVAKEEYFSNGRGIHAAAYGQSQDAKIKSNIKVDESEVPSESTPIGHNLTSIQRAKLHYEVFRAKKVELEYREKLGELVNKEQVYQELFSAGKLLRDAVMNIPEAVVDDLLAARSRAEALELLTTRLADALRSLAELGKSK